MIFQQESLKILKMYRDQPMQMGIKPSWKVTLPDLEQDRNSPELFFFSFFFIKYYTMRSVGAQWEHFITISIFHSLVMLGRLLGFGLI